MAAGPLAALAASIAIAQATPSGAGGVFDLPTPTATADGKIDLGLSAGYWRGGDFLLPGATSQRTGTALSASTGFADVVEAFGAFSLTSTNLFSAASRRTLVSFGDLDLGIKLLVPGRGPFSAGVLLQLDVPSGVGGFSLNGTGGRAAGMMAYAGRLARVSALAGYRVDNSGRLVQGAPATFPAFALGLSSYDVAQAGAAVEVPLRYATPGAELAIESPVPRRTPLPEGDKPLRARLTLGLAQVATGMAGVTFSAALQMSLSNAGRISQRDVPSVGFSPDPPWTVMAGLSWTFDRPAQKRDLQWHEPLANQPAAPQVVVEKKKGKAVLQVTVLDAKTQLPIAGAWVSFLEGTDVGGTTGPDGRVRVEADAGSATLAVARDGYELLTQPVSVAAGEEQKLAVQMQEVAPDAAVRGRLLGEDGMPLRAAVVLSAPGTLPALPAEPQIFEGAFSLAVQHGSYELNAIAPGYRCTPLQVELRPGETATRDLELRRIAGEPRVRMGASQLEIAQPIVFAGEAPDAASLPVLAEIAQALKGDRAPLEVVARVEPGAPAGADEVVRLSGARARAVIELLKAKGLKQELTPRPGGLARPGQPLLELKVVPLELRPRAEFLGGHPR